MRLGNGDMSTQAPKTLFDPELTKAQLRPVLDIAVPLLSEVLAYSLALFARCSIRPEGDDENLVILLNYRHLLELLDSVNIQLAECAPSPAALQLRAMFEALLTIEYVTQDKAQAQSRALAYLYQIELGRRRFYLSQDANTPEGKAFRKSIENDPYASQWKPLDRPDLGERVKEIDALLDRADFREIGEEYRRTKKAHGRNPHWYSLYDGPRNIRDLADLLKRGAWYAILYKELSERGHSVDTIDRILTHNAHGPAARSLRDPTEFNSTVSFAISFAVEAARFLIRYYRLDEEPMFAKWLRTEIMPNWNRIPNIVVKGDID
jgi:Family of unknown function (DUF5677)